MIVEKELERWSGCRVQRKNV
ncbi:hypothetical protein RDI58_024477 [Solanum bulbocastanum]|uniref:Uncharacterized protein n=1 Tax=Solanum bulbocastanum TaxID=147425 RepID=A0AAN8Y3D8_SOLBU